MQALILAAGKGSRLQYLGKDCPKCLLPVGNKPILARTIDSLVELKVNKIFISVNHQADDIIYFCKRNYPKLNIKFIDERDYPIFERNNIYSLSIALSKISLNEPTLLIEGDIIFNTNILKNMIALNKSATMLSKGAPHLEGSGILVKNNKCTKLVKYSQQEDVYKTVNIYYFKPSYLKKLPKLIDDFVAAHEDSYNYYYEEAFNWAKLMPYITEPTCWYEVDMPADYYAANIIYSKGEEKYNLLCSRYGGHWRFPGLIDCCYLANPFFKPNKLINLIRTQLPILMTSYPSGEVDCRRNAASLFDIQDYSQILVGNGATELINILGSYLKDKKAYISLPAFNEYLEAFNVVYTESFEPADTFIIVNPNNPTGLHTSPEYISELINRYPDKLFIIDESFNDFVDRKVRKSFIGDTRKNIVVIKSLGKSYGVNGLKLGILYSANTELVDSIRKLMPSWNINSIAQEFLAQIKYYEKDYNQACEELIEERNRVIDLLAVLPNIVVYDSQTDFITMQLINTDARKFCIEMLDKYNIFIKCLLGRKGFEDKNCVRISLNAPEINNYVIKCLKEYLYNMLNYNS